MNVVLPDIVNLGTENRLDFHANCTQYEQSESRISREYNFIAYGVDFTFLTHTIDEEMSFINEAIGSTGNV